MDDFRLGERGEALLRYHLKDIRLSATNNDRSVMGTMNQHIQVMPYYTTYRFGPVETWDVVSLSCLLNEVPVSANVWAKERKGPYFSPRETMGELLKSMTNQG